MGREGPTKNTKNTKSKNRVGLTEERRWSEELRKSVHGTHGSQKPRQGLATESTKGAEGLATKNTKGTKMGVIGFCALCAFCGQTVRGSGQGRLRAEILKTENRASGIENLGVFAWAICDSRCPMADFTISGRSPVDPSHGFRRRLAMADKQDDGSGSLVCSLRLCGFA
jgi:hypothetical protein